MINQDSNHGSLTPGTCLTTRAKRTHSAAQHLLPLPDQCQAGRTGFPPTGPPDLAESCFGVCSWPLSSPCAKQSRQRGRGPGREPSPPTPPRCPAGPAGPAGQAMTAAGGFAWVRAKGVRCAEQVLGAPVHQTGLSYTHTHTHTHHTHTCRHTLGHTHVDTHMQTHTRAYTHVHTCRHTRRHTGAQSRSPGLPSIRQAPSTHTHTHTHRCTCTHTYRHTCRCTRTHMQTCTQTHIYAHRHTDTGARRHKHRCTCTHTCRHAHRHTDTGALSRSPGLPSSRWGLLRACVCTHEAQGSSFLSPKGHLAGEA